MKDDAVIKDNEAVYLINEQTYLHLRENLAGVGYEVFDKNSPLPVEEGQIPREVLGNSQRRIETARAYYLAEHQDEPVGKIQNVAVTTLEKFRSGVRKRRNLAPRSLPENDVRFIDPQYNELFRVPDGGVVQMTYPDGHQRSERVEYLDDYHMKIGSSVQHICEFAERIARSHAIVEPEPLTQQDCRAWNLEYDYYLTVQAEDGAWEYALYQGDCCLLERGKIDAPELMIEEVRDEILYSHNLRNKDCIPLTQEEFAQKLADRNEIKLNISDRHLGKIERGEGTASIDLLVEVAISLNTTLDFLILGVLDTPRERELNAQIKKQHQKIQIFKNKLSNLIDELDTSASV